MNRELTILLNILFCIGIFLVTRTKYWVLAIIIVIIYITYIVAAFIFALSTLFSNVWLVRLNKENSKIEYSLTYIIMVDVIPTIINLSPYVVLLYNNSQATPSNNGRNKSSNKPIMRRQTI